MSPALAKMLNARADFTLTLTDESLVSEVEGICKELKEATIVKKLSNKFEFLVKPIAIDTFKKYFNDQTKYELEGIECLE